MDEFEGLMREHTRVMRRQAEPGRPPEVPAKLEDVMKDNLPGMVIEYHRAGE